MSDRNYSKKVVDGVDRAPSRAMLRAVGFETDDFNKPQIGVVQLEHGNALQYAH